MKEKNNGGAALPARDQAIRGAIKSAGGITHDIHKKYFREKSPGELRAELRRLGFTGHERLYLNSVEVLPIVIDGTGVTKFLIPQRPQGVDFKAKPVYGLAGGTCKDAVETPEAAAVRLMSVKYGITINEEALVAQEVHVHQHRYEGNGDECEFSAYRYLIFLEVMPQMNCDPRYTAEMGVITNPSEITINNCLDFQLPFIHEMMKKYA